MQVDNKLTKHFGLQDNVFHDEMLLPVHVFQVSVDWKFLSGRQDTQFSPSSVGGRQRP